MAVRIDASTDTLTSTGITGSIATVTCWMRIVTDTNDFGDVWQFLTGPEAALGSEADGTTFEVYDSAFNVLGATAFSVGTWYRTAVVMNGTAWTFYRGAAGAALTSTAGTRTAITSPTTFSIGLGAYSGRVANVKVFTAALSQAEAEAELGQYIPTRAADLNRWYPFIGTELVDRSGNGNTLTAGGTGTTTEDGPPIPWSQAGRPIPQAPIRRAALF